MNIIKWAGGKGKLVEPLAKLILPKLTEEATYIEPFLGSGALFFHLRRNGFEGRALLADTNVNLVFMWRAIQNYPEAVFAQLQTLPLDIEEARDEYYNVRAAFNANINKPDETQTLNAARFIWLNRMCFNGLYRVNKSGEFNVPLGSYKTVALPNLEDLLEHSRMLRGAKLVVRDFEMTFDYVSPGDVLYADPPYVPLTPTADFTSYTSEGFNAAKQEKLAELAWAARLKGVSVVLSNHDLSYVRDLYKNWTVDSLLVRRSISREGSNRAGVYEAIIY